jgi:hypothetical protein
MSVAAHPHAGLQTVSWLFTGEIEHRDSLGNTSPAKTFAPIVGAEIDLPVGSTTELPIIDSFEYGVLVVPGQVSVNGHSIKPGQLHYVPAGSVKLVLTSANGAKLILLGGEPFKEKIVMWWNFIRGRIPAPPLPNLKLKPRGNPPEE